MKLYFLVNTLITCTNQKKEVVTSNEIGVETTTNKIHDITEMNTENKEDITDTITSDYPINESKTVETSTDILVGSTEDVTNGGLNKITLYIEDATEEYFAVEEFTEINIIENTSFQESIVRETKPKVTLHIQNQSQVSIK